MPLDQDVMDRVAQTVAALRGTEALIYWHRATLSDAPVGYPGLQGLVTRYSEKIIAEQLALTPETTRIQREDRQLRLATTEVTWTPTLAGSVTRADGTTWRVMDLAGGTGYPFWRLRIRKMVT